MKKPAVLLVVTTLIFIFCADIAAATDYRFRLSTNQNALDAEFDAHIDMSNSQLITGISGVYDNDDFKLLFLKALISNELLFDGLSAGLGFKGAWGEAEKHHFDRDVLNLGFACYVGYDLSKSGLNNLPILLTTSFYISPEPLAFGDTEELIEVMAEGSWKVLDQAAIVINYRYIEIDFDQRPKMQKSDSAGFLGLRFFF